MFLVVYDGKELRLLYWVSQVTQYNGRFFGPYRLLTRRIYGAVYYCM